MIAPWVATRPAQERGTAAIVVLGGITQTQDRTSLLIVATVVRDSTAQAVAPGRAETALQGAISRRKEKRSASSVPLGGTSQKVATLRMGVWRHLEGIGPRNRLVRTPGTFPINGVPREGTPHQEMAKTVSVLVNATLVTGALQDQMIPSKISAMKGTSVLEEWEVRRVFETVSRVADAPKVPQKSETPITIESLVSPARQTAMLRCTAHVERARQQMSPMQAISPLPRGITVSGLGQARKFAP